MDRQAVLGYILIFVLLLVWMWMNTPRPQPPVDAAQREAVIPDTATAAQVAQPQREAAPAVDLLGRFFSGRDRGHERILTVETELYRAEITSKGGVIRIWELKKYKTWDGFPVQLIDYDHGGDFSLLFTTADGRLINTRNLYFDVQYTGGASVELSGNQEYAVELSLPAANGGRIVKTLRFKNGEYGFEGNHRFVGMHEVVANFEYQVIWESGLRYAEHNSIDESSFAAAYVYAGRELTELDAAHFDERPQKSLSGIVDWVATRNKYFALAMIPRLATSDGAYVEGARRQLPDNGAMETYSIAVRMPFKGSHDESSSFTVFLGPMDIGLLRSYDVGLEKIMSLGWTWIIRPISEYIMLPTMSFLFYLVPNWGVVIIIFSIIIKIVLHPLTKSSMKSMKKMQALQPMMSEIREKYKDDPQKMNQQIMNLYKEYGVNPAGGCFPLLLQFPILIALYNVFRATIELRQASFVWWIQDLSIPDRVFSLPFTLPLFGIKDVSGLALLMGITMFIQQKMTIKDPRQKAMIWMMPLLMTLLFNSFPSGLNLYYFVFNLLSIGQQFLINKQAESEPLRKVEPRKRQQGGIFGKIGKDLPKFRR